MLRAMQALPSCPSCRHEEWVRANLVVVPGALGPLRVSSSYADGPTDWTCANCGYVDSCGGEIERLLDLAPEHVSNPPSLRHLRPESGPMPREPRPR
jgi:predicted nucleic-acid-binding Zn-ribbon protein